MANTTILVPGLLSIEQVARSPYWRMRWKNDDGSWQSRSTRQSEYEAAETYARQFLAEKEVLKSHGVDVGARRTVGYVVDRYVSNVKATVELTEHKRILLGKAEGVIKRYAGDWKITEVTPTRLAEFEKKVADHLGRVPSKSHLNQLNMIWRSLFRLARDQKWCSANDIPELTLKGKGRKAERRPAIDLGDYKVLRRFLRTYHEGARTFITRYKRQVLREYIIILIATGMRPGEEPLNLKWKHISNFSGAGPVTVTVPTGKTGTRPVVAMSMIKRSLSRLRDVTKHTEPEDYVFCMPDGSQLKDMSGMVVRCFSDAGIRYDNLGKKRTAYSLRHTYATLNYQYRNLSFTDLSNNMGTSIVMIEKHYSHVTPLDIADRLATGRTRQTTTERKVASIHDILKQRFSPEEEAFLRHAMPKEEIEDDFLFLHAFEIEVARWNEIAKDDSEKATGGNLKYVLQAAQNRAFEFLHGDTIY